MEVHTFLESQSPLGQIASLNNSELCIVRSELATGIKTCVATDWFTRPGGLHRISRLYAPHLQLYPRPRFVRTMTNVNLLRRWEEKEACVPSP